GILKAGGAYVPLDPAYPPERLRYMLEDSSPVALLTQRDLKGVFSEIAGSVAAGEVGGIGPALNAQAVPGVEFRSSGRRRGGRGHGDCRSGSSGIPKGVSIEHRNAVNFIDWGRKSFAGDVLGRTLFCTSLSFDLAVYECFVPITIGSTIRIVRDVLDIVGTSA